MTLPFNQTIKPGSTFNDRATKATLNQTINFKVQPLYQSRESSKDAFVEINQAQRDMMFSGDSMQRKELEKSHADARFRRS